MIVKIYSNEDVKTAACNLKVDIHYCTEVLGYQMRKYETALYNLHYSYWKDFIEHSSENWLMICHSDVVITENIESITAHITHLPSETEIFFPYDKLSDYKNIKAPIISGTRLGFYWGTHFYFINRRGAEKMLVQKTIFLPLDERLLSLGFKNKLNIKFVNTLWFEYDEWSCRGFNAKKRGIVKTLKNHEAWSKLEKEKAIDLLQRLLQHAKKVDCKLILHAGTLLGAVRHGRIMQWDDDIDVSMLASDLPKFLQSIRDEGIIKVTPWIYKKTGNTYYKFWLEGGEKVQGYEYAFPFIDIWLIFGEETESINMTDGYVFDKNHYFPPRPTTFENCEIFIPNQPRVVLNSMYKKWHRYIKVFAWCHRLKKPIFKKHVLPITTNKHGRLVNL